MMFLDPTNYIFGTGQREVLCQPDIFDTGQREVLCQPGPQVQPQLHTQRGVCRLRPSQVRTHPLPPLHCRHPEGGRGNAPLSKKCAMLFPVPKKRAILTPRPTKVPYYTQAPKNTPHYPLPQKTPHTIRYSLAQKTHHSNPRSQYLYCSQYQVYLQFFRRAHTLKNKVCSF